MKDEILDKVFAYAIIRCRNEAVSSFLKESNHASICILDCEVPSELPHQDQILLDQIDEGNYTPILSLHKQGNFSDIDELPHQNL